mmetsp:Transcript_30235/g.49285  ORF Transcript_30235/g.49285 Transcript_30235/m.49285 type:complete len:245 (-) Transcript_30235:916-1650(-)
MCLEDVFKAALQTAMESCSLHLCIPACSNKYISTIQIIAITLSSAVIHAMMSYPLSSRDIALIRMSLPYLGFSATVVASFRLRCRSHQVTASRVELQARFMLLEGDEFLLIHLQNAIQLSFLLKLEQLVVVTEVLVVDNHNWQLSGSSFSKHCFPVLSIHDVHWDPRNEVLPQMNILRCQQRLGVVDVAPLLEIARCRGEEAKDLALTSDGEIFFDYNRKHRPGNMLIVKSDVNLVHASLLWHV